MKLYYFMLYGSAFGQLLVNFYPFFVVKRIVRRLPGKQYLILVWILVAWPLVSIYPIFGGIRDFGLSEDSAPELVTVLFLVFSVILSLYLIVFVRIHKRHYRASEFRWARILTLITAWHLLSISIIYFITWRFQ
jgi:hypothetical protein